MSGAGERSRRRLTFQQRALDAHGERLGPWADVATRSAKVTPLKGGEGVQEQRLQGAQPVIISVLRERVLRPLDNSWQAFDAHAPTTIWDISSVIWNQADNRLEILAVERAGSTDG